MGQLAVGPVDLAPDVVQVQDRGPFPGQQPVHRMPARGRVVEPAARAPAGPAEDPVGVHAQLRGRPPGRPAVRDSVLDEIQQAGLNRRVHPRWDRAGGQSPALVAGQDVELVDEGSDPPRWRIAQRVPPDRVISTVDPQARHAHKTVSRRQDGFKAHVAVEPDTGVITDCALTQACGTDADGRPVSEARTGLDLLDGEPEPVTVLADSAYGSGEFRAELADRGHTDRVKPAPTRASVPDGFTVDDFVVDHERKTATCPAGVTRPISRTGVATFDTACATCPLRQRCTRSRSGKHLKIRPHDALQRAARKAAADPAWQAEYRRHRPMVERSIAWLARGNRRVHYRGVAKNDHWLHHRAAGLNLRRLITLGLGHDGTAWALG